MSSPDTGSLDSVSGVPVSTLVPGGARAALTAPAVLDQVEALRLDLLEVRRLADERRHSSGESKLP